jgi:ABC-type nitrate/sulfonate/bicarbonate transport system permease component
MKGDVRMKDEPGRSSKSSFGKMMDNLFFSTIPGVLLFMGAWELFFRIVDNPHFFPGVSAIAYRAYEMTFLSQGNCPLLSGTGIVIAFGIIVGIAMGRNQWVENLISPTLRILLPIPAIGMVPILVVWLGTGNQAVIFIIALAATLPIIAATWDGAKATKPNPANPIQSLTDSETIPSGDGTFSALLPSVLSGIRIGLARGRAGVIAGEAFAKI